MNAKTYRYVFWPLWFVLIPAALGYLTVALLSPSADFVPSSWLGEILWLIRDQRVPAIIVFFAAYEMVLYRVRHHLPFAAYVGTFTRTDVPRTLRRDFEEAGHLLEEAERIRRRRRDAIESTLPETARTALNDALVGLRERLEQERFDAEGFPMAFDRASQLVSQHLGRWRKGELREYAESIAVAMGVALLLRALVIEAFKIPSGSMLPTLQIQDHIFVNKLAYGPVLPLLGTRIFTDLPPRRGDIIVFEYPDPDPGHERQDFIKRVIALDGDVLEVDRGHPVINGWKVPSCRVGRYEFDEGSGVPDKSGELYVEFLGEYSYLTLYEDVGFAARQGPYYVAPGETWVLGDNRNNSSDSRAWYGGRGGGVPDANIKGRAMFVWLSFGSDNITWDRIFTNVLGKPRLPKEASAALVQGIERCLGERPVQTLPPPPDPRQRPPASPASRGLPARR